MAEGHVVEVFVAGSAIFFSGRVQGVGFRQTAVQLSLDLQLAGTVRNLEDGRVELLVDGLETEIQTLLDRLKEHFGGFIRKVERHPAGTSIAGSPGIRVTH